jgi:hypothetical protein
MRHHTRVVVALALTNFVGVAQAIAQGPTSELDRVAVLEQQVAKQRRLIRDWGGLTRYGSDDTEIPPPARGENRVIFLGDQITESWGANGAPFFAGKPYFN